ncbi:ornithine cyclodeaminase family protein [Salsuginibacillus kocurii]|uniref:ornithine cyclodeaminase family protein n=1 Tax=Salsuginibacillus kocurii TaxID=427078 RepID=UPI00037EF0E1|nr:ornithine cyclodeaminase family protein [Salsuginibacillus kocurii]
MSVISLLLSDKDIRDLICINEIIPDLEKGMKKYQSKENQSERVFAPLSNISGAMVLMPGLLENIPAYTVKVHSKFSNQSPSIKGVIHLHDLNNGNLLSIMDSAYITAVRTSIVGAIGTHLLSRHNAHRVAIVGCGIQGELQLKSLSLFRDISVVYVFDLISEKAVAFANKVGKKLNLTIIPVLRIEEAIKQSEILILATWSKNPLIFSNMLSEGTHITSIGADQPDKCEISVELIKKAKFICDDKELTTQMGAIASANLSSKNIDGEIGDILNGHIEGRTFMRQNTILSLVGLAFQDLAVAWRVYNKAISENVGEEFFLHK